MSRGLNSEWTDALEQSSVTTYIMARLDFANEPVFIWTGGHAIQPTLTGDALLDNNTFLPLIPDVIVNIGDNAYSISDGSDVLELSIGISATAHPEIAAAQAYPDEYQSRPAYIWRCIVVDNPTVSTPAMYAFRKIKTGSMDQVIVKHDGQQAIFSLTIEGFATFTTNVSNSTYLDQPKFDATDTSQQYAVAIANGEPAPVTKGPFGIPMSVFAQNATQANVGGALFK